MSQKKPWRDRVLAIRKFAKSSTDPSERLVVSTM
jgi:hypothetical protein